MSKGVLHKFRKKGRPPGEVKPKPYKPPTYEGIGGAIRRDEFGTGYFLNEDQLVELAILNEEVPKDEDKTFWAEFRKLRVKWGVKPLGGSTSWSSGERYKPPLHQPTIWSDPAKGKSYKSEWWSGWGTSGISHSSELNDKLAVAMRSIRATGAVIDDAENKTHISWATRHDVATSFTDLERNEVVISAKPFVDKLPDGEALDICSGFSLHEFGHSRDTRLVYHQINGMTPMAVAAFLANIVEDVRTERNTANEFPGFKGYFDALLEYMFEEGDKPTKYGDDLVSRLNGAIMTCRWPEHAKTYMPPDEFEWWTRWMNDYLGERVNLGETVKRGLEHLRIPDQEGPGKGKKKTASGEMDEITKAEKAGRELEEIIKDFLKGLKKFCAHEVGDHKSKLDPKDAKEIEEKVAEELEEWKPHKLGEGDSQPTVQVSKPIVNHPAVIRPDPLVTKYRNALRFRPAKPLNTVKLMKNGKIDSTQLWRWAGDDWRVFQTKEINDEVSARVYLLADMSGSMGGLADRTQSKLAVAERLATLFLEALDGMDGVHVKVFGHTGDYPRGSIASLFRIWEPGDNHNRIGWITEGPHSNNYDGYAIDWSAEQLLRDSQPNEQKLLIVLSDGYPSAHGYGGERAYSHMRRVIEYYRKRGIRILQIAIDPSLDEQRQEAMFGKEYVPYVHSDTPDMLPGRLAKQLAKLL